ncbi:MAG TPA: hypothetical protein VMK84_16075 [Streptosporangiaceae bacterium]|nr:hypothetical protein [Streptosporangiaceae bacterium]
MVLVRLGAVAFVAASAGCGLAGSGAWLIAARGAQGLAADEATWSHRHPATGERVASFPVASPADVDRAVHAATSSRRPCSPTCPTT